MAKEGLLKIDYTQPYHPWANRGSVSSSSMKSLLGEIFDSKRVYTFFTTIGNPEAVKLLAGFYGEREESGDIWKVHKKRNDAIQHSGFGQGRRALHLDPHLKNAYLTVLGGFSKKEFGAANYRDFSLVNGASSMDAPPEAVLWPHVHVIRDTEATDRKYFQRLVDSLTSDDVHANLRKNELPQNYRTGEIDTLHEHRVNPLVLEDRVWVVSGKDLGNALDFLMPFTWDDGKVNDSCRHCDDD